MVHNVNIGSISNDQWQISICIWLLSREGIDTVLPDDAHLLASDRLHVSVTDLTGRNHLVSRFSSRDDLIMVHTHTVLSHCWSYSYLLQPCFPFKWPTFFSWWLLNECFQDRSGCNISVKQCFLNYRLFLLQALLASSYLPVYAGVKPVEFRGQVIGLHTTSPLIILTAFIWKLININVLVWILKISF